MSSGIVPAPPTDAIYVKNLQKLNEEKPKKKDERKIELKEFEEKLEQERIYEQTIQLIKNKIEQS